LCDTYDDDDSETITIDHISHETFRQHSTSKIWNLEQYRGLPKTLYGRYATDKWPDDPNPLTLQLRRNRAKIFFEHDLDSICDSLL
jgi:hypothetical protein